MNLNLKYLFLLSLTLISLSALSSVVDKAQEIYDKGQFKNCIEVCETALIGNNFNLDQEEEISIKLLLASSLKKEQQYLRAIDIYTEIMLLADDEATLADVQKSLGEIYFDQGSYDQAAIYLKQAKEIVQRTDNKKLLAGILFSLGSCFNEIGNDEESILTYNECIRNSADNEVRQAACHEALGRIHFEQADFNSSVLDFEKAHLIYDKYGMTSSVASNLEIMSQAYHLGNDHRKAKEVLNSAIEYAQKWDKSAQVANYYQQLALWDSESGSHKTALAAMDSAYLYLDKKDATTYGEAMLLHAQIYEGAGKKVESLIKYHDTFEYAKKNGLNSVLEASARAESQFLLARGDHKKALVKLMIADSLSRLNSSSELTLLRQEIGGFKMSEAEYLRSHYDALLSDKKTSVPSWLWFASGGLAILCIVFIVRELVHKKRTKRMLEWKVYKGTLDLRKANKELNTFVYKSSHDLRTPLTSIKSLITLLNKEDHSSNTKKYLGMISGQANQMDQILINLTRAIDYKVIDLTVEKIDFQQLKVDLEQKVLPDVKGVKIQWDIDENITFHSDQKLLKEILQRTISNAISYRKGNNDDFCRISVSTDHYGATVSIEDNGVGIAENVKENVFDMFVKGTHKSKGAGLGLYLVKIATDKLKGKIKLETTEQKGARFTFTLPDLNAKHHAN